MIALTRDSTPWTAMPKIRNGSNSSHTIGYKNSAANAKGQQTINNKHQSTNVSILYVT